MLEYFAWTMLAVVFGFLLFVNIAFVPLAHWWMTFKGFFQLSGLPHPIDWGLIGALAATAGSGGLGNLTITNWVRDKGFGMGAQVGAIPSAIGGLEIKLSHVGKVFRTTPENMARWRNGCVMCTPISCWSGGYSVFSGCSSTSIWRLLLCRTERNLQGLAAGAYQAKYLAEQVWPGFWFVTLFNGFWILFKTQLGNTDILVRTVTDALWMASGKVRDWRGGQIQKVYYGILLVFSIWSVIAVRIASPMKLFTILANIAGIVLAIAGVQILIVNRRFLPAAIRPPLWREVALLLCVAFYAFFSFFVIRNVIRSIM